MVSLTQRVSALYNGCLHAELQGSTGGLTRRRETFSKLVDQTEYNRTKRSGIDILSLGDTEWLPLTPSTHARLRRGLVGAAWCHSNPAPARGPTAPQKQKRTGWQIAATNELATGAAQTLDISTPPESVSSDDVSSRAETAERDRSNHQIRNGVSDGVSERAQISGELAAPSQRGHFESGCVALDEAQNGVSTTQNGGLEGASGTEETSAEGVLGANGGRDAGARNGARRRENEALVFEVRLAETEEELMAAACLRADVYASGLPYTRFIDSYRKQFAQQEFGSLLKRTKEQIGRHIRCRCLVAVDTTALASSSPASEYVIGTLDVSLKQLMPGQRIPGELSSHDSVTFVGKRPVTKARKFAYVSNVCVPENARRKGVARRMMDAAAEVAQSWELREVFCHVDVENKGAQKLYKILGYEKRGEVVVQESVSGAHVSLQRTLLLRAELHSL